MVKRKDDNDLVTKGYLREFEKRFETRLENKFQRHVGALMEDNRHNTDRLVEAFNTKFEILGSKIDSMKDTYDNWLSNHEERLIKLESR